MPGSEPLVLLHPLGMMRSGLVRPLVLPDIAQDGDPLSAAQAVEATRDLLGCAIADDLLSTGEEIAPLDPRSPYRRAV